MDTRLPTSKRDSKKEGCIHAQVAETFCLTRVSHSGGGGAAPRLVLRSTVHRVAGGTQSAHGASGETYG